MTSSSTTPTRRRPAATTIASVVVAVSVALAVFPSAEAVVVAGRRGAVISSGATVARVAVVAPYSNYNAAVVVRGRHMLASAPQPAKAPVSMTAKAPSPVAGCMTVQQVLDATPELSRLKTVAAIVSEPLQKEFGGSGQRFTLFAPTNDAIEFLLSKLGPEVASNQTVATTLLSYHIIPSGASFSASLKDGQSLVHGLSARGSTVPPLKVRLAGASVIIDAVGSDAAVIKADVAVCRGVVHIIDTVLLPVDLSGGAMAPAPAVVSAAAA